MNTAPMSEPARFGAPMMGHLVTDTLIMTRRNLMHVWRRPESLFDVTLQPIVFVFLFLNVIGGSMNVPGGHYREYLMPGVFVWTVLGMLGSTASGVAEDMTKGIIDRFRSLPMARAAVLLGRSIADLIQGALGLLVTFVVGMVAGWRPEAPLGHILAAFCLLLLLASAMNWLGALIGLLVRTSESVNAIAMTAMMPFMFMSNLMAPSAGMSSWLRPVAEWNPVSAIGAACRLLFGSPAIGDAHGAWPLQHPIGFSFAVSTGLLVVSASLAVWRYQHATSR